MRPDKRQAILRGALSVFSRDGYSRASIDAIAKESEVSTRTLYNHFADKADLFRNVIQVSASEAADDQIAIIGRHFHKVTDLEKDLAAFGKAMCAEHGNATHFALVRQINAELTHIPAEAIEAWQETGPRRVLRELAARLDGLGFKDPKRAAVHLMLLTMTGDPSISGSRPDDDDIAAGVRVFLHGHDVEKQRAAAT
ncbi:DNA-binding transcriptional regulator, AcrR family [Lentzea waywayandensis]|uniref:DNA-binding transcriptional regulator, AcrR family n=1 Tax=Lentzea waywayandensis TaxID=84724 RepID=A0A1I6EQI9_9PSEU|nr:TetR/AcrR family transcriptional regulator [Lentzea waywayandensis]SFR20034.1 DNA-binding transcriptional regulator, AcrR family [Lentzea waywayandensis]